MSPAGSDGVIFCEGPQEKSFSTMARRAAAWLRSNRCGAGEYSCLRSSLPYSVLTVNSRQAWSRIVLGIICCLEWSSASLPCL